ncbi:Kinase, NEK [Giardia muris]|uniref:non-specific serine/threonine protein kinase n=1 Tax=Giardia muris TaxID=5742 RepID=A0A4Z1T6M1_GIAMU|nr:Kinase, NEK [Giardia muris]|eukprot:TNJ28189.1 Kinase, NEK [Giardia muris]
MRHLHEHDWFCRGLSPASIYLSKDGKCVLAPFELAQPLDAPLYLAPEIQRGSPHDPAADVWTLGAIVYEMCAGVPPFKSVDEISSGAVPRIRGRPGSLTDLVARMLSLSPESRPSIQECLRSVPRGSDPHPPQGRSEDRFMEALRSRGREAYEEAMSLFEDGLELSPGQEAEACRLAIANGWSRMAEQFKEAYRPEEGRTTMLMCAAMDRNLDLLRRYVHERRRQDENGWTALMLAAQAGHLECARILLPEAWIRTTRPASDLAEKGTAMMLAAQAGHADIVELLWPYECCGKDANDHNAYWYAQKAAKNGERIREILDLEGQGKVRRRENIPAIEDILGRKE